MRAPLFWKEETLLSAALLPAAAIYGWLEKRRRTQASSFTASVPVICVGNVVAGGAGKTPVALALGALLKERGKKAHYLSRGYKGSLMGPVQVNPNENTVGEVGDEPLLLAEILPTWVAKDRTQGAKAAMAAGADTIIMDDGFQNPGLHKDIALLVIDGGYGFGNERLMPAGPLREPIASAMERATAIILLGEDKHQVLRYAPEGKPVLRANLEPMPSAFALKDKHVVAFAGIARPRKFYRTLQQLDCVIRKMVAYPDHYVFKAKDIAFLRAKAKAYDSQLVTTTKDYVRLSPDVRAEVTPVAVQVIFEDNAAVAALIAQK